MTESRENILTLVAQSTEETDRNHEQSIEEIVKITSDPTVNTNQFHMLCDNVQTCFSQLDNSMYGLLEVKDKLLLQYLPCNVSLQITLVLSRLYRAYSLTQIPVYELIRLVQLYSQPFDTKCIVLKNLHEGNETKKRMLNIALRRLTTMEKTIERYQEQQCINNWEKMYIRLALPRSNVRKWKFRMQTFREKAILGYEHVIDWLQPTESPLSETSITEQLIDNQDDDPLDAVEEIISESEIDELKLPIHYGSDDVEEIGSDNEGSFLSSPRTVEKSEQIREEPKKIQVDAEIQVQPNFNDQQTSTDEILSTKSLIMRIYRPVGITKTHFQCIVYAQGQTYTTNKFDVLTEQNKERSVDNQVAKSKSKRRREVSSIPSAMNINTTDKQQNDELLIPMPDVFKRCSLLENRPDPDAIKIDVLGDEQLCGSLRFSSEDFQMLDLPTLYSSTLSPLIAIDENVSPISTESKPFVLDQPSDTIYQLWNSRTPQAFLIYDENDEPIGKLPIIMFWYYKIEHNYATKSTMTDPMEMDELLSTPILNEEKKVDDHLEIVKASYEQEIARIHENYQGEIYRLTKLLNEVPDQMADISELDENMSEMIQEELSDINIRQRSKRKMMAEYRHPSVDGKGSSKNFLDRNEMYLQRSIIHRHQLTTKIEQETALAYERQMEIQHRLHRSQQNHAYDDLCLPAVFMPFRSGNVFNPRAYQFFHSAGSTEPRLTQPPSICKLPALPSRTISVLNLFEISRSYNPDNDKDRAMNKTTGQSFHSTARPTTQESNANK